VVALAGSKKVPVFGKLMEEMEVVFVDRGASDSRQATLDAIKKHCSEWKPRARPLLIFPEGTTTNGEGTLDFRKGAFVSGAPVRPTVIVYTGRFNPASTSYKQTAKGVEKTTDVEWAQQFMGHLVHSLHVRVLPPYFPNEAEKADADLYARNVNQVMRSALVRVKGELLRTSWKTCSGRTEGRLGYQFGDLAMTAINLVRGHSAGDSGDGSGAGGSSKVGGA
jgi:lysophosphatidylcholine acyltransferase/lyso-PAF acetyltransferase